MPGGTTTSPSGFRRSEAIFATSFVRATPTEIVSPTSSVTADLIARPIVSPSPKSLPRPRDVQEGLVDRDRLDERREPPQDRQDLLADPAVLAAVDRQEDPMRAERAGGPQRHRRVDAEDPRLVARGAHDAALVGPAATDDHGLAAELGPIALLDGREERVEVDVEDRPVDRRLEAHPG